MITRALAALVVLGCGHALGLSPLAAQEAAPASEPDSTFLLTSDDAARSPSPFIGNGHLGVVIPPLGIEGSLSLKAGLYDEAPGDVPRIAAVPTWSAIGIFDGDHWLELKPPPDSSIRHYRQVIDMRTGTARTTYEWVDGTRRTTVRIETIVSRADPRLAAIRLDLTPAAAGRMRVRFALSERKPPPRLALGTIERAQPDWGPVNLWYGGHMVVRTRNAALEPGGGRVWVTSTAEGRTTMLAQVAAVGWPRDLPGASGGTRSEGDTAAVEVAFAAEP